MIANHNATNIRRRAGASLITHLFNAMPSFHHRDPGLVGLLGAAEEADRPYYSLIADGLHCHSASIKIATRSHPKGVRSLARSFTLFTHSFSV